MSGRRLVVLDIEYLQEAVAHRVVQGLACRELSSDGRIRDLGRYGRDVLEATYACMEDAVVSMQDADDWKLQAPECVEVQHAG